MLNNLQRYSFVFLLLAASNASAEWYAGGAYTFAVVEGFNGEDFSPSVLMLKGGYNVNRFLAAEARVLTGLSDSTRNSSNIERKVEIGNVYGAYVKLQSGGREFNPYLVAGYTKGDMDLSKAGQTTNVDDNSASYGIGVDAALSETTFFNLEYMQYYDKDDLKVTGIGIGVTQRF